MLSGFIQEYLGWKLLWVFVATIPGLILSRFSDIPERILEKKKNQINRNTYHFKDANVDFKDQFTQNKKKYVYTNLKAKF
jgi:hypothetical protein